jgi:hypothetical protein
MIISVYARADSDYRFISLTSGRVYSARIGEEEWKLKGQETTADNFVSN